MRKFRGLLREVAVGGLPTATLAAGVVFMVVEPPKKLPLLGMTRWIDKKVPVIQQTGRWGKDGFVIWALFHDREISEKAAEIGIAPGVAVHQMHRRRMLDYSYGNSVCVDLAGTYVE